LRAIRVDAVLLDHELILVGRLGMVGNNRVTQTHQTFARRFNLNQPKKVDEMRRCKLQKKKKKKKKKKANTTLTYERINTTKIVDESHQSVNSTNTQSRKFKVIHLAQVFVLRKQATSTQKKKVR
jgi:uncharacterized protein YlxW (UPF0749 family)